MYVQVHRVLEGRYRSISRVLPPVVPPCNLVSNLLVITPHLPGGKLKTIDVRLQLSLAQSTTLDLVSSCQSRPLITDAIPPAHIYAIITSSSWTYMDYQVVSDYRGLDASSSTLQTLLESEIGQTAPEFKPLGTFFSSSDSAGCPIPRETLINSQRQTGKQQRSDKRPETSSFHYLNKPESEKNFACPYHKKDPVKVISRSCVFPGFSTIHRLKEHLLRVHFRAEHKAIQDYKGMTEEQRDKIKFNRKERGSSEVVVWSEIFSLLFPVDPVPSPYVDEVNITDHLSSAHEFKQYCKRNLPSIVDNKVSQNDDQTKQPLSLGGLIADAIDDTWESWITSNQGAERVDLVPTEISPFEPLVGWQDQRISLNNEFASSALCYAEIVGPTLEPPMSMYGHISWDSDGGYEPGHLSLISGSDTGSNVLLTPGSSLGVDLDAEHVIISDSTSGVQKNTSEDSLVCSTSGCDKVFHGEWRVPNLRRHLATVHGPSLHRCSVPGCSKAFKRGDALRKHQFEKHRQLGISKPRRQVLKA